MTLYALKPRFQEFLRPIVEPLPGMGVTANLVTIVAALGSIVVGAVTLWLADFRFVFLLIPVWLFVRMALNAIDGMLARDFHQKSRLGGYLNEIGDVVSDAALYVPFAFVWPFSLFGIGVLIVLSIMTEFAGALGPIMGASRRYDGPIGKSDRAVLFGGLGLWVGSSTTMPASMEWAVPILALLLVITVINRVRAGIAEAEHAESAALPKPWAIELEGFRRPVEEKTFQTHDGVELFYRYWPAARDPARGAIVLFHRGHEHSGRMAHLADELNLPDFAVFAWDARGQGRSPGARGFSPSFGASVRDVQTFVEHIATTYGYCGRGHRRGRPKPRRRARGHVGARLRTEHPLHGARLAGVQGQALCAVRAHRL